MKITVLPPYQPSAITPGLSSEAKALVSSIIQELSTADAALLGRQGCGESMAAIRRAIRHALALRGNVPQEGSRP